jgi:hypothetical protein
VLTELGAKKAQTREHDYKLFDALGLFLRVGLSGSKLWRSKYRYDDRECLLALDSYPETSLKDAHALRARTLVSPEFCVRNFQRIVGKGESGGQLSIVSPEFRNLIRNYGIYRN